MFSDPDVPDHDRPDETGATPDKDSLDRPAMEGGDRERGDRGPGADEAGIRSHELSEGTFGATADYGDG